MGKGEAKTALRFPGKITKCGGKGKYKPSDEKQENLRCLKKRIQWQPPKQINLQLNTQVVSLKKHSATGKQQQQGRAAAARKSPGTAAKAESAYILQIARSFHNPGSEKFLSLCELSYSQVLSVSFYLCAAGYTDFRAKTGWHKGWIWVRWSLPFGPNLLQAGGKDIQIHTLPKLQTKPAQQRYLLLQTLCCYEEPGTAAAPGCAGLHLKAHIPPGQTLPRGRSLLSQAALQVFGPWNRESQFSLVSATSSPYMLCSSCYARSCSSEQLKS